MRDVTLKEIAERVGVSPSTVSRALNDHPRISTRTKTLVRHALLEMGRERQTEQPAQSFGMFLTRIIDDAFMAKTISGVLRYTDSVCITVFLERLDAKGQCLPHVLMRGGIDGMIVGGIPIPEQTIHLLLRTHIPIVFVGRYLEKEASARVNYVASDNVAGGRLAARHLISCGYDQTVVLRPLAPCNPHYDRLEGFMEVMCASNILPSIIPFTMDGTVYPRAFKSLLELTRSGSIGVFSMEDLAGVAILKALQDAGIRIPEQAGVIGYSGLDVTTHTYPPLSTIDVDKEMLGFCAARLLHGIINGQIPSPMQIHIQPRLIARASTVALL